MKTKPAQPTVVKPIPADSFEKKEERPMPQSEQKPKAFDDMTRVEMVNAL